MDFPLPAEGVNFPSGQVTVWLMEKDEFGVFDVYSESKVDFRIEGAHKAVNLL